MSESVHTFYILFETIQYFHSIFITSLYIPFPSSLTLHLAGVSVKLRFKRISCNLSADNFYSLSMLNIYCSNKNTTFVEMNSSSRKQHMENNCKNLNSREIG